MSETQAVGGATPTAEEEKAPKRIVFNDMPEGGFIEAIPKGYDFEKHKSLLASQFSEVNLYYSYKAVECKLKSEEFLKRVKWYEEKAEINKGKEGRKKEAAMKRTKAVGNSLAALKEQLKTTHGMSDEEIEDAMRIK